MIKIKTFKFTKGEIRALEGLLYSNNACNSGCIYPEMEKSKKDCDECKFTEDINSILNKIED